MSISAHACNMRKHDRTSLLHAYSLRREQTVTMPARTSAHPGGKLRIKQQDLHRLRDSRASSDSTNIVALFCTGHSDVAVTLQAGETMWVKVSKEARVSRKRDKQKEQDTVHTHDVSDDADWQPLTVIVSHAYVRGMRVSGIIHRAVVRLSLMQYV